MCYVVIKMTDISDVYENHKNMRLAIGDCQSCCSLIIWVSEAPLYLRYRSSEVWKYALIYKIIKKKKIASVWTLPQIFFIIFMCFLIQQESKSILFWKHMQFILYIQN